MKKYLKIFSSVIPAKLCHSRESGNLYRYRFPIKSGMTNESAGMTRKGQSLIEILIAISAITIVLTALVSAATRSLSGSVFARTQALATKTAEDQMEKIRANRDRNGLENITCSSTTCYLDDSLQIQIGKLDVDVLKVWFTVAAPGSCPAGNRQVTVISQWIDGKGTHQAKSVSCFSLWQ